MKKDARSWADAPSFWCNPGRVESYPVPLFFGGKLKFRHRYRYRIILGNGQVFLGSRGFTRFTSKTPISESDIISMLCIALSLSISEFRYKIPIWRGARSWPMGPSERRLPTGSSAQMAPSANWAVGTKAQFALVGSHEKLGF